jgi:Family of unknown function (DUF6221)
VSDDLVAFLRARLDEDEREAEYALEKLSACTGVHVSDPDDGGDIGHMVAYSFHSLRHNPARVLRQVKSGRKILALHHPDQELESWYWGHRACAECKSPWHRIIPHRPPTEIGPETGCPTLQALAAVYDSHPGYRQEWKP